MLLLGLGVGMPPALAIDLPRPGQPVDVERILKSMTLEERVGQLLMIGFGGTRVNGHSRHWVGARKVGGVALFSRNIESLEQIASFTRELHGLVEDSVPIFLALDQEGGNVVRVKDGAMLLPGNMALGASRSSTLAYVAGQALAIDLNRLGFNMNLAPVLDVNSNPRNPVIGVRSYGERPDLVAHLGSWYVRGQQEMSVVAVAKHFPGHGDTHSDSHYAMPAIDADLARLEELELWPFRRAIEAGLDAVMTAHIALPRVTENPTLPATLSRTILTDILRHKLNFEGIAITDGLEMQGIVKKYGSGRAAVLAVLAGADMPMILWTPRVKEEVYQSLLKAVRTGEITEERLNTSVRRILRVKARRGLFHRRLERFERVMRRRNRNPVHEQVAGRIAREAVTLVRNHGDIFPLRSVRYRKVVVAAPSGPFSRALAKQPNVALLPIPYVPNRQRRRDDVARLVSLLQDADLLIMTTVNRYHVEMVRQVMRRASHVPVAVVSLASPYYLTDFAEVDAYVCTYSYLDVAQEAVADAVLGKVPMRGRLPISIPGFYAYGHRVEDRRAEMTMVGTVPEMNLNPGTQMRGR